MKPIGRRDFLKTASLGAGAAALGRALRGADALSAATKPNLVIFFTDDQGYNDVGCYGSPNIKTPNFDRMAEEGIKLTSFYAQPVCGPSRAAIMTGCYPLRVGEPGNRKNLHTVPHTKEIMLPEVLRAAGYRTAIIGKWHLAGGRRASYDPALMPNGQGFDYFYGTPLHNGTTARVTKRAFAVQLMRNGDMLKDRLEQSDMDMLTHDYTKEAIRFITENKDRPFFLYLSHNMPHVPLGVSKAFKGRSAGGIYGDVIEELDWSAGEIVKTLKKLGLDDNTLVVFTSDNGPWIEGYLKGYYGSADPLRGSKMMTWDGGPRVPCIMRWPGRIPAGKVSDEIVTTMDLLPTFAKLAGTEAPTDRTIDGKDIYPLVSGRSPKSPHEAFYFYAYTHLQAVRSGDWKLVLPRPAKPRWMSWWARMIDAVKEVQLFDLKTDIEEKRNVAGDHPEVVERLMGLLERAREDIGDRDRIGRGARFFDPGPRRPDIAKYKRWKSGQDRKVKGRGKR